MNSYGYGNGSTRSNFNSGFQNTGMNSGNINNNTYRPSHLLIPDPSSPMNNLNNSMNSETSFITARRNNTRIDSSGFLLDGNANMNYSRSDWQSYGRETPNPMDSNNNFRSTDYYGRSPTKNTNTSLYRHSGNSNNIGGIEEESGVAPPPVSSLYDIAPMDQSMLMNERSQPFHRLDETNEPKSILRTPGIKEKKSRSNIPNQILSSTPKSSKVTFKSNNSMDSIDTFTTTRNDFNRKSDRTYFMNSDKLEDTTVIGVGNEGSNNNSSNDVDRWIVAFGYPAESASRVLGYFQSLGRVEKYRISSGNWMYIKFSNKIEASRVLSKNGKIFERSFMVGVAPAKGSDVAELNRQHLSGGGSASIMPTLTPSRVKSTSDEYNNEIMTNSLQKDATAKYQVIRQVSDGVAIPKVSTGLWSNIRDFVFNM